MTILLLLLAGAASAQTALPPLEPVSFAEATAGLGPVPFLAAAETPEERARHQASLRWPGGPRSTYRHLIDPARRRPGDPARDIVSDRWPGSRPGLVAAAWYLDENGVERAPFLIEGNVAGPWSDSSAVISRLVGRPAIVSPEYIALRMGARALIAPSVYGVLGAMPPFEAGRDAAAPWLHLLQFPTDSRGDDCVSLNRVGAAVSGCGDLWQDGVDPVNELACHQGKTYLRCHLWCWEQVEGRSLGYANGPCPSAP
ncbi:MAG: hypothetical protein SF051_07510 [Elusimicrobiota bacterium]|nr:hypothetical protein [Elusimicrobiota bacterium]